MSNLIRKILQERFMIDERVSDMIDARRQEVAQSMFNESIPSGNESIDHKNMDVSDLIYHLADHPATKQFIDYNAPIGSKQAYRGKVPMHQMATALGIKPEHVESAMKRIQKNSNDSNGKVEFKDKHITLHDED